MRTFQRFDTQAAAEVVKHFLETEGIPVEIENVPGVLDSNFIGQQYGNNVFLKIPQEDFNRARQLLIDHTQVDLGSVDKNYMLFSLSNEELEEVLAKPEEWGAYNYNVAKAILQQRNVTISNGNIETRRLEHLQAIAEPKRVDFFWIAFTYFLVAISFLRLLATSSIWLVLLWMVPVYCAVWGWSVARSKKTLPDGTSVYTYDTFSRKHGIILFICGVIAFFLTFAVNKAPRLKTNIITEYFDRNSQQDYTEKLTHHRDAGRAQQTLDGIDRA